MRTLTPTIDRTATMPVPLTPDQLARDLGLRDLTDPAAGPHAVQLLVDTAVDALSTAWGSHVRVERGSRVVCLADNYDRLGYPAAAVTRDARYTRYVDDDHVLRSHTSAMIPPALTRFAANPADDVLLVCPGITYRRDTIDRLHTGSPHQLDLWRIARTPLSDIDLAQMSGLLASALVPDREWRSQPRVHPYTLNGREVDVRDGQAWVEVWECGLAHPDVLANAELEGFSGLALGMGLERLLMLRKAIPDIRLVRSADPRISGQMIDLEPYRPVSDLPAMNRDLSVAIAVDDHAEQLGDRIRDTLGGDADLLEAVTIVSETSYNDLPDAARERLGMQSFHKNVLVRVTIRPFDRTLTDTDANIIRDRVYDAIHQGSAGQWTTK